MRRYSATLAGLALATLATLAACAPYAARSDFDPTADFTRYKTYAHVPPPERGQGGRVPVNPSLDAQIRAALDRELPARGFVKAEGASPDLLVGYYLVVRDRVDWTFVNTYWGWGWGGVSPVPYTYSEGTLVVDLVDATSRRLVWLGWTFADVDPLGDPTQTQELVDPAVATILENYPPAARASQPVK